MIQETRSIVKIGYPRYRLWRRSRNPAVESGYIMEPKQRLVRHWCNRKEAERRQWWLNDIWSGSLYHGVTYVLIEDRVYV